MAENRTISHALPVTTEPGGARIAHSRPGRRGPALLGSLAAHAVMIVTVLICIFPMVIIISTSFKLPNAVFDLQIIPSHPTLSNYQYVLSGDFVTWLLNSLKIGLLTTLLGLAFAAPAAYAVSRWKFVGKQGLMLFFLITQMFPAVLLIVPLYILFAQLNLLDNILGLVIAYATTALPFSVWMLKNFFDTVPKELDEAARVDGANAWQRFWAVTFPSIRTVIIVTALLSSIWTANSFENVWLLTQGGPSDATMVFPVLAYFGMQTQRIGEAAAVSVATLPVLAILVIFATSLMHRDED